MNTTPTRLGSSLAPTLAEERRLRKVRWLANGGEGPWDIGILDGHGALAVGKIHHDEAVRVGLGGHAGLAAEQVEGSPGRDRLLEAAQAAAAVGQHEVVEGVGLEVCDELFGGAAIHIQREPIVLDLWAGAGSVGSGLTSDPD